MSFVEFNAGLLAISDQLSSNQLDDLKFLCRDIIGKKYVETTTSGRDLFRLLTERQKLGPDNTEFLSKLLEKINRPDLSERLNSFQDQSGSNDNQPDDTEKAKLDIATDVIQENLGKNWRKLGRKLGLKDIKLESISRRHPTDLEETAVELLKEWRKSRGADARTEDLIAALRACQLNMTADKVEDKLK
ncbi:FAS-associated death domain protein [Anabas testudineus]|uniref:Fas (tnfrsf6)-associated via death domain n=1 Tax=Anabas testudineus TaxID=64144 RepID=A0AAQ6ID36_ANATE|nr:FAS-associated death domain protein [Anabas testudineus]